MKQTSSYAHCICEYCQLDYVFWKCSKCVKKIVHSILKSSVIIIHKQIWFSAEIFSFIFHLYILLAVCISCFDFIVYIQSDSKLHWSSAKVVFLLMYSMFHYGTFLCCYISTIDKRLHWWFYGYVQSYKDTFINEANYASDYIMNII